MKNSTLRIHCKWENVCHNKTKFKVKPEVNTCGQNQKLHVTSVVSTTGLHLASFFFCINSLNKCIATQISLPKYTTTKLELMACNVRLVQTKEQIFIYTCTNIHIHQHTDKRLSCLLRIPTP